MRPDWDHYFLEIAHIIAKRSTCKRRQVGALIIKDRRILATGYNGPPSGIAHCADVGCMREQLKIPAGERHELCRGLHAEQNAIIQASLYGVGVKDSVLYCTHQPCIICTKMIINAGIREVKFVHGYPDELSRQFLEEAKIRITKLAEPAVAPEE